jgi:thiol:disulfide interchange protein
MIGTNRQNITTTVEKWQLDSEGNRRMYQVDYTIKIALFCLIWAKNYHHHFAHHKRHASSFFFLPQ